jgi:hypothetical protein
MMEGARKEDLPEGRRGVRREERRETREPRGEHILFRGERKFLARWSRRALDSSPLVLKFSDPYL